MSKLSLLIAVFLLLPGTATMGQVYTWTDENGQVHYGSQPPTRAVTKEVKTRKYTPDQQSINRLNQMQSLTSKPEEASGPRITIPEPEKKGRDKSKSQQAKSEAEKDRERCERYKERYARYKREGVMGYNLITGETKKMTGQAKRDAIESARQNVEIFCNP